MPAAATPEERAKEVVLAAYSEGRMVGIVTASIGLFEQVRARVAMLRGSVDPEFRRSHIGIAMFAKDTVPTFLKMFVSRGQTELGWLHSRHTFSFGNYFDPDKMGYRSLRVSDPDGGGLVQGRLEPGQESALAPDGCF